MARKSDFGGCGGAAFGSIFLCVGLGVMGLAASWWWTWRVSAGWTRVPATILKTDLKTTRSSKGGTSYRVSAKYKYAWPLKEGAFSGGPTRNYFGDRVGLESGSSSGSEHRTRHSILEQHQASGEPFLAWVNPHDPEESLLFREPGMGMLALPPFGLLFALVGGFIVGASVLGSIREKRRTNALQEDPSRPWLAEERWRCFDLPSDSRSRLIGSWSVGLFLSLFGSIFAIAIAKSGSGPGWMFAAGFSLIPVALLGWAVYLTLRHLKYGISILALTEIPIPPGRSLTAILRVKRHLFAQNGVVITVQCEETTGSGKHQRKETLWSKTMTVREDMARHEENGSAIPILAELPADRPAIDPTGNRRISWTLEAKAATPGVDFGASFELPVYAADPALIAQRSRGSAECVPPG